MKCLRYKSETELFITDGWTNPIIETLAFKKAELLNISFLVKFLFLETNLPVHTSSSSLWKSDAFL